MGNRNILPDVAVENESRAAGRTLSFYVHSHALRKAISG
jgi:hypothetical protein